MLCEGKAKIPRTIWEVAREILVKVEQKLFGFLSLVCSDDTFDVVFYQMPLLESEAAPSAPRNSVAVDYEESVCAKVTLLELGAGVATDLK